MEIYFWHLHLKNLSLYTYVYLKLTMPSKGLTINNSNNILAHLILIDSSKGKQNDTCSMWLLEIKLTISIISGISHTFI